jgi:hypothetical protein
VVPVLYLIAATSVALILLVAKPVYSFSGLFVVLLGIPVHFCGAAAPPAAWTRATVRKQSCRWRGGAGVACAGPDSFVEFIVDLVVRDPSPESWRAHHAHHRVSAHCRGGAHQASLRMSGTAVGWKRGRGP